MGEGDYMAKHKIANYGGKLLGVYEPEKKHELAIQAGKASGETRRKRRAARDVLMDILHSSSTDKDLANIAKDKGIEGTELATLLIAMTKKASKSANMAELVFRLTGDLQEQPQQNITIVNQLTDEQLQRQIADLRGQGGMIDITPEPPKLEE
jgi:hypothetical protein